jgi:NAD(P)-dependent dehydrogenase (short-subunit alcohol dehydrogenase family)
MSKTILITGTSSGFGRDRAETLRRAGHTVYASMRGAEDKNHEAADALRKLGIKTVELDVCDDTSVEAGVKTVLAVLAGQRPGTVAPGGRGDLRW